MGVSSQKLGVGNIQSILRKAVLAAATILGVGYILVNVSAVVLLGYRFSQIPISSLQNVTEMSGMTLFLMASVILMIVGVFVIIGGLQYYRRSSPQGVIFIGSLLASFYLLCLGIGSMLILSEMNFSVVLLIISPILLMVGAGIYMGPSSLSKLIGSILGIVGGILLAIVILNFQILEVVFPWDAPFPGPFMSLAVLEGIAVILGPIAAFIYSILAGRRGQPIAHVFLSIVGLVYGIGVFIESQTLAFSFLDLLWKAPWLGPFYGVPDWIFSTVAFWSASLFLLEIGGIILIVSSCMGFMFAAQEFSQL